jgi:type IV secretion system protein TrbL
VNVVADLLDFGWLPDAIVRAIIEFIRNLLVGAINAMFNFGLKPLLTINPGILSDAQFVAAWDDVFSLSIALLPILIAAGLIVMPFSEDREASLWQMVARIVAVIVFIAISKPLFAFMIEASNGVTTALAPATFKMTFDADLGGSWGATLGMGIQLIALIVAVPLMLIATILATLLLALRQFLVVTVALGAPFFAVLWYANWGPMKSVSKFAATWLRMGIYGLLVGPIIALVMRVFDVIATGGIAASGSDAIASFYIASALALMFPIILFVVIWKTIGWAGQPLGVDAAFTTTVAAAIAATGVGAPVVAAGVGSGSVSSASKSSVDGASGGSGSSGGSGGAGGGSAGSSAGSSGGTATDPSAGTANSSVGGTMRNSISDALSTREPPAEDSVETALGALSKTKDYARRRAAKAPGVQAAQATASQTSGAVKKLGSKAKGTGVTGARKLSGTESIDTHRRAISQQMDAAAEADANRDFLTEAYQNGEIDVGEAAERGILSGSERPAEGVSTVAPDPDGVVTYPTAEGYENMININDRAQHFGERAHTIREDASKSARSVNRIRTAQAAAKTPARAALSGGRAGKRVGKAGIQTGKASGVVFAGAMTRSPYAAYQIGKRGGKHLIGPGAGSLPDEPSEDADIDWSTRRDGPGQATTPPWDDDAGGEPSETV